MIRLEELIAREHRRRISRAEYDRMVDAGIFEGQRIELLHGVIIDTCPNDPSHASPLERLTEILVSALKGRARVRIQLPLVAADDSEPEPDVALVPVGDYSARHPDRAYLVIEVAGASLRKDRAVKAPLYAASGVEEYWVVNLAKKEVEVHRGPTDDGWATITRHGRDEALAPVAFPDVVVKVAEFLGA